MGVKGAALATIISQAGSAIWVLSFLTSSRASLRLEKQYMKPDRKVIGATLALGISPFIMASTESLVGFVLNGMLKTFGDIYVSALTVMQSSMLFVSVPLTGFALGFVPIVSYNYGHGNKERVKECFRIVVTFMFLFNFVLMLLMILFPSVIAYTGYPVQYLRKLYKENDRTADSRRCIGNTFCRIDAYHSHKMR